MAGFPESASLTGKELLLKTYTDDQNNRERICEATPSARLLVEAGPGTGKTEMAALRIAGLIETGLSPGQLLVLSFSRSAVRNLTGRLARLAGTEDTIIRRAAPCLHPDL